MACEPRWRPTAGVRADGDGRYGRGRGWRPMREPTRRVGVGAAEAGDGQRSVRRSTRKPCSMGRRAGRADRLVGPAQHD